MANRKEINAFNISFLDILAGALGAIILLFIVVPKMSLQDVEKLEQIENLEVQMSTLDSLLEFAKDAIPNEDYQALIEKSQEIMATVHSLNDEITRLQANLQKKNIENTNLLEELRGSQEEIAQLKQQITNQDQIKKQMAKLQQQLNKEQQSKQELLAVVENLKKAQKRTPKPQPQQPIVEKTTPAPPEPSPQTAPSTPGKDSAQVLSFNPPLAVMIEWEDPDLLVHLYMKDVSSKQWCFYQAKRRRAPFGKWQKMKKITSKPHEAIIQDDELVPGTYEIYATIAKPKSGATTNIEGFAAMQTSNGVQKVSFGKPEVHSGKPPMMKGSANSLLGTLTVTEDNLTWNAN